MRFIILLRGINVGGKNRVPMSELKRYLTNSGFTTVTSYINSGNLFVDSKEESTKAVLALCQRVLSENYDFPIKVLVIPAKEYQAELANCPTWWGEKEDYKHNVLFFLPLVDKEKIKEALMASDSPYDKIFLGKQAVFWSSSFQKNYSKTHYSKLVSKPYYKQVTIRNRNTAIKLLSFLEDEESKDKK